MAIVVPTINGPQVQESSGPSIRINSDVAPDAFNAGQSFNQLSNVARGVAYEEIRKAKTDANEMALNEATARATQSLTDTLYNPETGLYSQKGKNAAEGFAKAQDSYRRSLSEIENSLTNDDQRRAFRQKSLQLSDTLYQAGGKHLSSEIAEYDTETSKARISANRNMIGANPFDPDVMSRAIEDSRAVVASMGQRQGWSDDVLKENLLETESKARATGIEAMLNAGKYSEANNFFQQSKEFMTAQDRDHLEHSVREGALRTQSQSIADDLFSRGVSLSDGFKEIRQIEDPDLKARAYESFRQVKQMDEMAKRDRDEKINIQAANILDQNGGDISKIPPTMFTNLSTSARSEIQRYAVTKQKGLEPKTDWAAYNKVLQMASTPDLQDKFMQTDLFVDYRNKMSDSEFKELVHLQSGLRKSDERVKSQLDDYRTKGQIVSNMIGELGFKNNSEEANRFEEAVTAEQRAMQNQLGRKLTNDEMEKIVRKQAIKVPSASWFSFDKRAYEYPGGDITEEISPQVRAQIEASLKARNRPPTAANISAVYLEYLRTNNGK